MRFEEIIDLKHWQNIQDCFSSMIGIALKTVSGKGENIVQPSNPPEICTVVLAKSPEVRQKCCFWYQKLSASLAKEEYEKFYEFICPLGLMSFAIPLVFKDAQTAFLIIGPVIIEQSKQDVHLTKKIQEFELDEVKFFECFNKLVAVNTDRINNSIEFLHLIIAFMTRLESFQLEKAQGDVVLDKKKVEQFLRNFLELAMKLCDAERGSVMMFEKNTQELSIKDAKGLSEEIIEKTKLKPGEGLAGLTIEQRKALFLNEQLSDREVRLRMNRPKIKSAFVIPVFYKDEILGVVSVGTTKKPNRFSDKLMELLNELVEMGLEKISLQ
ncbi:MAG: PocR ligand-binding domain-containing protein [Candidatus Omnitrophica bacterium]|nr:PocR ligand-binding domain-containing protein [Candidatus Omnitrophota bacterium]